MRRVFDKDEKEYELTLPQCPQDRVINRPVFQGTMTFPADTDWEYVATVANYVSKREEEQLFIYPFKTIIDDGGNAVVSVAGHDNEIEDSQANLRRAQRRLETAEHNERLMASDEGTDGDIPHIEQEDDSEGTEDAGPIAHARGNAGPHSLKHAQKMLQMAERECAHDHSEQIMKKIERWFGCTTDIWAISPGPDRPKDFDLVKIARRGKFEPGPFGIQSLSLRAEDFAPKKEQLPKAFAVPELDELIGLEKVKRQIREIVAYAAKRKDANRPCLHMAFTGNPGTGKTTIARVFAQELGRAGILEKPENVIEVGRNDLVGGYVGQTALKTQRAIGKAMGGLLFIDEAYALAPYDVASLDYGQEALATLVKAMEDYRDEFVCIMAGYTEPMERMISCNPGMRDRIAFRIDFPDYDADELMQICETFMDDDGLAFDETGRDEMWCQVNAIVDAKDGNFGNARVIRKVFERCRMRQGIMREDNLVDRDIVKSVFSDDDLGRLVSKDRANSELGFI